MVPLSIVEKPFQQIALDIMGLFPKSSVSYQYIPVTMDYTSLLP